ncbi:hypothetical protein I4U23_004311 [Adineta vaga]|nr:hypothetical protein I4U23_004311 [Adineta vaga]
MFIRLYLITMGIALFMATDGKPIQNQRLTQRINTLLDLIKVEKSFEEIPKMMVNYFPSMATEKSLILTAIEKFFSFKSLRPQIVELYREVYTPSEINAMIKFYSTPLGKSVADKDIKLEEGFNRILEKRFKEQQPQIEAWFSEQRDSMETPNIYDEDKN